MWLFENLTRVGNTRQIEKTIRLGVIPALCALLTVDSVDTVKYILSIFIKILHQADEQQVVVICQIIEACGGLEKIEKLEDHKNEKISEIALKLKNKYFDEEVRDFNMLAQKIMNDLMAQLRFGLLESYFRWREEERMEARRSSQ